MQVWNLYQRAKRFGISPSDALGLRRNPWVAWQFDNAVSTFGTWVENKLAERTKDNKPKHRIEKLLDMTPPKRKVGVEDFLSRGVPVRYVKASGEG